MTSQFNHWLRVSTPILGLLTYGLFCFVNPQTTSYYQSYGWKAYSIDILSCIIGSYLLFESSIWFTKTLDRWLPWDLYPVKRILIQFSTLLAISSLTIWFLTNAIFWFIIPYSETGFYNELELRQSWVVGGLMTLFINAIYVSEFFFQRWKTAVLTMETLKRESVEAQFETLRNQLDPHFLFNNLNTLIYLVEDNTEAVAFVEKLALVYRYLLQNRDQTTVPLRDELTLAQAYLFLLKHRYGMGIETSIEVPESALDRRLPPMTLQLLLENAVKHNQADPADPLRITIKPFDYNRLVVENTRRPRQSVAGKNGIGLQNIRSRYQLLAGTEPVIEQNAQTFSVTLPLLSRERVNY